MTNLWKNKFKAKIKNNHKRIKQKLKYKKKLPDIKKYKKFKNSQKELVKNNEQNSRETQCNYQESVRK